MTSEQVLFSSLTFWGWISLIWGVILLIGSHLVLTESPSSRPVAGWGDAAAWRR